MDISTTKVTWHGLEAWALENENLRIVTIPALGAKLVSLFDKRNQFEWLVEPGARPLKQTPYGSVFVEQDMSGWDEMFPTIVACPYPVPGNSYGAPLPDHGEVWTLPWTLEVSTPEALVLHVEGKALPYRLTRTLSFSSAACLQMHYELKNLGQERMPYLWAAHPQFVCREGAQIQLPAEVVEVCNTIPVEWGWGEPETRFSWPEAVSVGGQRKRIDIVGPPSRRQARKFFLLPEHSANWAGLVQPNTGDWLRLEWDPNRVSFLGIWIDEGVFSHTSVTALEPTTGFYDSLATAWHKQQVATIESGATHLWTISVRLGTR
jgi:galactose mutarotase-like enzyme